MKTTYLSSSTPLTKSFILKDGKLEKIDHPRVIDVTSHEENCNNIEEFYEQLKKHAELGHCLLKGNVKRPLHNESRAGSTDSNEPTEYFCFDLDGLKEIKSPSEFMTTIGQGDVDYITQYSSSMGIVKDRGLSAHIYVLSKSISPNILKLWLTNLNFKIPALRNNLKLTRTNVALKWGLDISTCQNDKLIYIAPPILGEGVIDEMQGKRIELVKGSKRHIDISDVVPSAEFNHIETQKVINQLREKEGLPPLKKQTVKTKHNVEYVTNPDRATVTGIKTERGFTYININGGDSWGYYHPENNPEFIYNFKGESVYKTSELLPDYWRDVKKEKEKPKDNNGIYYLVFRDFRTAAYHNVIWDSNKRILKNNNARSKEQLHDFLAQYGQPMPEVVPDWDILFEPNQDYTIDIEGKKINTFVPTDYMNRKKYRPVKEVPPNIKLLIMNAVGDDEALFEHFMNSLACIFQYRDRTETCWLFHGVPGTGKGMMLSKVLVPIFGKDYVYACRQRELDSAFNNIIENKLILWIDEANFTVTSDEVRMTGDLKNYVTEEFISIRKMYSPPFQARNYLNIIMVGNDGHMIRIPRDDRRFNVGMYQRKTLASITDTSELIKRIEEELDDFACYLGTRMADKKVARKAFNNQAKELVMAESETAIDQAADALLNGNFQYFWDARPMMDYPVSSVSRDQLSGAYLRLLKDIANGKKEIILREEIQIILEYIIGNMPNTPNKFTSLLKHHKIIVERIRKDGKQLRGIKVNWNFEPETLEEAKK